MNFLRFESERNLCQPPKLNDLPSTRHASAPGTLIGLAAPVLELVLKLQTGVVAPSNEVRPS